MGRYSVSRLNEPKGSYAKYKFYCRCKFILLWLNFQTQFILPRRIFVPNLFCRGEFSFQIYFAAAANWNAKFILPQRIFVPNLFCCRSEFSFQIYFAAANFRSKFILPLAWSAKFILPLAWSTKFILPLAWSTK